MQTELSAGVIALEIGSRNPRVQALQARWVQLRAGGALLLTLGERGAEMPETPGGASFRVPTTREVP